MTAGVRRVSGLTVREAWVLICAALFLGLYCLVAFAVFQAGLLIWIATH